MKSCSFFVITTVCAHQVSIKDTSLLNFPTCGFDLFGFSADAVSAADFTLPWSSYFRWDKFCPRLHRSWFISLLRGYFLRWRCHVGVTNYGVIWALPRSNSFAWSFWVKHWLHIFRLTVWDNCPFFSEVVLKKSCCELDQRAEHPLR